RGDKVKYGLGPGEEFHHVLEGLYLGNEVSPQGRNDDMGTQGFQYLMDIVLLKIVPNELIVGYKGAVGEIGGIGVIIGTEFPVNGISHKPTSSQYQNPLFLQKLFSRFIER